MDALLIAFFACFLSAIGGPAAMRFVAMRRGWPGGIRLLIGSVLACLIVAAGMAWLGHGLIRLTTPETRDLMFALALLFAAAPLVLRPKVAAIPPRPPLGSLIAGTVSVAALALGEGAALLILTIAAAWADPIFAGAGGATGLLAAMIATSAFESEVNDRWLRALRLAAIPLLLVPAMLMAVFALRLV